VAAIKETCNRAFPGYSFKYNFLTEIISDTYRTEHKVGLLFFIFSGLIMLIACLGIFGLASYAVEQRFKEIAVRKVLGASTTVIMKLLTREFIILIAIAYIIACPVAYYAMNKWLESFAYRVNIGIATFLLAGFSALFIALLTVSYQAIKAARANPIDAIQHE
jgi:putative ABC transport system permease protein